MTALWRRHVGIEQRDGASSLVVRDARLPSRAEGVDSVVARTSADMKGAIMSDRGIFLVFTNPVDGMEEYNRWYDEKHVSDLLKVPGIVRAYRLNAADVPSGPGD